MKDDIAILAGYAIGLATGLGLGYVMFDKDDVVKEPEHIKAQITSIDTCVDWWTREGTRVELAVPRCEGMVARLASFGAAATADVIKSRSEALWACVDSLAPSGKEDLENKIATCEHVVRRIEEWV